MMRKEKMASDADYDEQDRRVKGAEVFVGGLPRSVTAITIREIFSPCGEIVELRMMKDQSGNSKGFCFVRFAEKESALIAQKEKDGIELQGRKIAVALSLDQDSLFFGNLRKEWSAEEFENIVYKAFRDVVSVDLALASISGDSFASKKHLNRGFAFVRFSCHAAAARAYRIGSKTDFLLDGDLHPAIDWAEKEPNIDPDVLAKVKTAFVGNLPTSVDEEYLEKLFEPLGKVERVALSRKGHFPVGFVHFARRAELDDAIKELDGKMVRGPNGGPAFKIQVSVARPAAEKERKRVREEGKSKPANLSINRPTYSYDSHTHESNVRNIKAPRLSNVVPDVVDPYEAAVVALPSAVKERLLRVLRLGIGTRYDIDLHCINSLKQLRESAAAAVLDQFMLAGGDKRDKGEYFASLVAKHRIAKYSLARSTSRHPRSNYLSKDSELHNMRVPLQPEAVDHSASRYCNRYSCCSGQYPSSSSHYDDPVLSQSSVGRYAEPGSSVGTYAKPRSSVGRYAEPRSSAGRYAEAAPLPRESRSSSMVGYRVSGGSGLHSRSSAEYPPEHPQVRFDPFTGQPYKFDPFTGEPIWPETSSRRSGSLY